MNRKHVARAIAVLTLVGGIAFAPQTALAQASAAQAPADLAPRTRVKLTVDRIEGGKPSSIPFELLLKAGSSQTTLNHGKGVPVAQTATKEGVVSYYYQSIGSNISITNLVISDKAINFSLMLEISLVDPSSPLTSPALKKYALQCQVSVRPGEQTLVSTSSDPLTGETVKLSVTADVVK